MKPLCLKGEPKGRGGQTNPCFLVMTILMAELGKEIRRETLLNLIQGYRTTGKVDESQMSGRNLPNLKARIEKVVKEQRQPEGENMIGGYVAFLGGKFYTREGEVKEPAVLHLHIYCHRNK